MHSSLEPPRPEAAASTEADHRAPLSGRGRLLILPTLNEEEGLELTLRDLHRIPFRAREGFPTVAVIDGGSTDRTLEVGRRWEVTMLTQRSRGKGAAVRE